MASIFAVWRQNIERLSWAELVMLSAGSLRRAADTMRLLLLRFWPLSGICIGIYLWWFSLSYGGGARFFMADILWMLVCVVVSRSSVVRKDWHYIASRKIVGIFFAGLVLSLTCAALCSRLVPLLPSALRIIFAWALGFPSLWGMWSPLSVLWVIIVYYMLDDGTSQPLRALASAVQSWIAHYPIFMAFYMLFVFLHVIYNVILYCILLLIASGFFAPILSVLPSCVVMGILFVAGAIVFLFSSLHLVAIVWYAAALAVYYESIRYRQE